MTCGALYVLLGALLIPLLFILMSEKLSWFRPRIELKGELLQRLQTLAGQSLQTLDIPVGAILLYDQTIIGEGNNTVLRDRSAGGHAEINAISSAIARMGYDEFSSLDRRKLVLLSTFEPCFMCVGACIDHNIPTVYYLEGKDAAYWLKERRLYVRYLLCRARIRNHGEQLALFRLHPHYPKIKSSSTS
jgi:tRNA(Arg) A34 adenosine deaminase TadA